MLTVVGKVRNTEQIWNEDRTSTNKNWGKEPILAQFIEIESILKFKEKPKVYAINRYGELGKEFNLIGNEKNWILKSDENNPTLNFYITRKIDNKSNKVLIIIITILLIFIIGVIIIFFILRKIKKRNDKKEEESGESLLNDIIN